MLSESTLSVSCAMISQGESTQPVSQYSKEYRTVNDDSMSQTVRVYDLHRESTAVRTGVTTQ